MIDIITSRKLEHDKYYNNIGPLGLSDVEPVFMGSWGKFLGLTPGVRSLYFAGKESGLGFWGCTWGEGFFAGFSGFGFPFSGAFVEFNLFFIIICILKWRERLIIMCIINSQEDHLIGAISFFIYGRIRLLSWNFDCMTMCRQILFAGCKKYISWQDRIYDSSR